MTKITVEYKAARLCKHSVMYLSDRPEMEPMRLYVPRAIMVSPVDHPLTITVTLEMHEGK